MSALSKSAILFIALLAAALHPPIAAAAEIDADRLFGDLDANDDGQVTAGEVGDEQRLLFKRLARTGDADGDGKLSAEEFAAALQPVRAEKSLVEKQGSRLPGADALTVLMAKMDVNARSADRRRTRFPRRTSGRSSNSSAQATGIRTAISMPARSANRPRG